MVNKYPLDGVRTRELALLPDERGFFTEILRQDWQDFIPEDIQQANLSFTYPGIVRAWHKHVRGQVDYFLVLQGAAKICGYDDNTGMLVEIISSGQKLTLIRMPGQYYHGFMAVGNQPSLIIYFTTRLYEYQRPDELRLPWNDPNIIPSEINGNKNDPRVNSPWDWFYPPHK